MSTNSKKNKPPLVQSGQRLLTTVEIQQHIRTALNAAASEQSSPLYLLDVNGLMALFVLHSVGDIIPLNSIIQKDLASMAPLQMSTRQIKHAVVDLLKNIQKVVATADDADAVPMEVVPEVVPVPAAAAAVEEGGDADEDADDDELDEMVYGQEEDGAEADEDSEEEEEEEEDEEED